LIGEITAPLLTCSTDYRLYGGCDKATLAFKALWTDALLVDLGDEIYIHSGETPVFVGRVASVAPIFGASRQEIELDGWWKRLDEIPVVDDPILDRIVFGDADDTDHAEITTAFGVIQWLYTNKIATADDPPATSSNLVTPYAPMVPAKFTAGGFAIYAGDKLSKVIETLAAMENAVCGIGADKAFYYIPRQYVEATTAFEVRAAEDVPASWQENARAYTLSGSFKESRQAPNTIQIYGFDADLLPSLRTYIWKEYLNTYRRVVGFYAPGIRTGPAARRLAAGLFKRFSEQYQLTVENIEVFSGTRRYEPFLGNCTVYDGATTSTLCTGLIGTIHVDWLANGTLRASITIGENVADPGSGNPITDPLTPEPPPDTPQVDTGEGTVDAPVPSQIIDPVNLDGDDLHTNPARVDPADPSANPATKVDYGTDKRNPTNRQQGAGVDVYPAVITDVGTEAETLKVDVLLIASDRGESVKASYDNVYAVTTYSVPYAIGEYVTVFFPQGGYTNPLICSAPAATMDTVTESIVTGYLGMVAPS
jgi:hypothetical protein